MQVIPRCFRVDSSSCASSQETRKVSLGLKSGKLFMEEKRTGGSGRKVVIPGEVHQQDKGTKPECYGTYNRP